VRSYPASVKGGGRFFNNKGENSQTNVTGSQLAQKFSTGTKVLNWHKRSQLEINLRTGLGGRSFK
jgi:hypothetical protein